LTGSFVLNFSVYWGDNFLNAAGSQRLFDFLNSGAERLSIFIDNSLTVNRAFRVATDQEQRFYFIDNLSVGIIEEQLDFEISITNSIITSLTINGVLQTADSVGGGDITIVTGATIGAGYGGSSLYDSLLWDVSIMGQNSWVGRPDGNLDPAWLDTIGSSNGTVNGSPTTTSILTGGDTEVQYTSFYPTCERAGTVLHDITENSVHISADTPSWSESLYGSDYLNQYGFVTKADFTVNDIVGVLDFDGVDDCVELSSMPDITGDKIISFSLQLPESASPPDQTLLMFSPTADDSDVFRLYGTGDKLVFMSTISESASNNFALDYADLSGRPVDIVVTKTTGSIVSVYVDGISQISTGDYTKIGSIDTAYIGRGYILAQYYKGLIWDININNTHAWDGHSDGNTDAAWVDTIGDINGVVNGSPTTTNVPVYPWETLVNITQVPLNDNTLVPLGQWDYQPLLDSLGDPITDSENDPVYTKENL